MARLRGMKGITKYENRSESTMLDLIRNCDYPAVKIKGEWEADTDMAEKWRRGQIEERVESPVADFIGECCQVGKKHKIGEDNLYKVFEGWWEEDKHGPECLSKEAFGTWVSAIYGRKLFSGIPIFIGIGLKK